MKIVFPSNWSFQQMQQWLEERALKDMGTWTVRGIYQWGVIGTPFDKINWSIAVWIP